MGLKIRHIPPTGLAGPVEGPGRFQCGACQGRHEARKLSRLDEADGRHGMAIAEMQVVLQKPASDALII